MKQLIVLLTLVFSLNTFAQNIAVDRIEKETIWGKDIGKKRITSKISQSIGKDNSGIFIYRFDDNANLVIEHWNQNGNIDKSEKIALDKNIDKRIFIDIVSIHGNVYYFSLLQENKSMSKLYVQSFNLSTLKYNSDLREISKTEGIGNTYKIKLSKDSSKILIQEFLPCKLNDSQKVNVFVFNNEMTNLWSKQITLIYNHYDKRYDSYVDEQGNVYFYGRIYDFNIQSKGVYKYEYHVMKFSNNGSSYSEFPIKAKDKVIKNLVFEVSNNKMYAAGYYVNKDDEKNKMNGICFFKINLKDDNFELSCIKDFDKNIFMQEMDEKQIEKFNKSNNSTDFIMPNYCMNEIYFRNDGSICLIGEQYKGSTSMISNGGSVSPNPTEYYYNNIMISVLNKNGDLDWQKLILKKTTSTDEEYLGYFKIVKNNKMYFIFNNKIQKKNTTSYIVEIGNDGVQKTDLFETFDKIGMIICPRYFQKISSNEFYLYGQWSNEYKYGYLKINL